MRSALPRAQLSPIVTDLEGDGQNEVVLVNKDLKLQLLAIPTQLSATHRIETPELIAEQTLLTGAKIAKVTVLCFVFAAQLVITRRESSLLCMDRDVPQLLWAWATWTRTMK
jgi:hypothetical protein